MKGQLVTGASVDRHGPVRDLLEAERLRPEAPLLRWDHTEWTVAEFAAASRRCAAELLARGVQSGSRVAIISGNSQWRLAWQYGIHWIGAVEVSVNSELRGAMLDHTLRDCNPSLLLVESDLLEYIDEEFRHLEIRHLDGPVPDAIDPVRIRELDLLNAATNGADLQTILYTSGTTGPSKGVMLPQAYFSNLGSVFGAVLQMDQDDVGYFTLPFFHVDAHIVLPAVIQSGAVLSFNRRFSVSRFWDEASRFDASWVFVIGALLTALETREVPEANHRVTRFIGAPIPESSRTYFNPSGIRIQAFYGQTECDGPTFETAEHNFPGSAGWPCAGFDVEIHDCDGEALEDGHIGEIVHRPQFPNMVSLGYWGRDDATRASWKGGWFHTGDLGRIEQGFLFYEGRLTDSLRRRGENVSAFELEACIRSAPNIAECAAIGVIDELGGEDDIKIVVRTEGSHFDPEAFFAHCVSELPRFAIPRFVEVVPEGVFHYSVGTGSIQKHRLSRNTTGQNIYDRLEIAGFASERK